MASTPSESGRGGTRPSRKTPAHTLTHEPVNRAVIVFLTVCTNDRRPVLANAAIHDWLRRAWAAANHWLVGRYVILPDHLHLFCAPNSYPAKPLGPWVEYWKSLVARATKGHGPLILGGTGSIPSAGPKPL
jgi:putative transposase